MPADPPNPFRLFDPTGAYLLGRAPPAPLPPTPVAAAAATTPGGVPHPLAAHLLEIEGRARALSQMQGAPRHWMLLFHDFAAEAAVHFRLAEETGIALGYARLAEALRRTADTLPPSRPDAVA